MALAHLGRVEKEAREVLESMGGKQRLELIEGLHMILVRQHQKMAEDQIESAFCSLYMLCIIQSSTDRSFQSYFRELLRELLASPSLPEFLTLTFWGFLSRYP